MKINIVNRSKHSLPEYSTEASAGMDLRTNLGDDLVLKPLERIKIPTGLFLEIPVGFEVQVRPRSGLAIKNGITILNSPGTVDAGYRGKGSINLVNLSNEKFVISDGERNARHEKAERVNVGTLLDYERGSRGFGHTGKV